MSCPKCHSHNVSSFGSAMKCKSCGHRWTESSRSDDDDDDTVSSVVSTVIDSFTSDC